jgi:putative DNA primase/helicase
LRAADDGVKRRIHLLEYKAAIAEDQRDLTFKERLRAEYPAILHSMIQGCLAWQLAGGLHKPDEITAAVDEYMESEDSLASWLADCTRADSSARAQAADVYRSYSAYIEARGERPPSSKRLGMMLRQKGFGTVKSGATYYTGLALLDKPGDTWTPDPSW